MPLTLAQMHALFPDNTAGDISAEDGRDVIEGLYQLERGTVPVNGDFSWVNQDDASITVNSRGYLLLHAPGTTGLDVRLRVKTAPSPPYVLIVRADILHPPANYQQAGICFRESSTGEFITFGHQTSDDGGQGDRIAIQHWASPTSFGTSLSFVLWPQIPSWWKIADDNTNRTYHISADGETWIQLYSEGRTTNMTADQIGFYCSPTDASSPLPVQICIQSWDES